MDPRKAGAPRNRAAPVGCQNVTAMPLVTDVKDSARYLQQLAIRLAIDPAAVLRSARKVGHELAMERRLGIRTAHRGFSPPGSRLGDASPSQPLRYEALEEVERDIVRRGLRLDSFVDLGCGRGRALAVLSKLPWSEMVGVEVDPAMAELARANVRALPDGWKQARRIEVVEQDAADWGVDSASAVVLLFNPFGEPTLRTVLTRLTEGLLASGRTEGRVDLYYAAPVHHRVVLEVFPGADASALPCEDPGVYHYGLTALAGVR